MTPKKQLIDAFKQDTEAVERCNRRAQTAHLLLLMAADNIHDLNDELRQRGLICGQTQQKASRLKKDIDNYLNDLQSYIPTREMKMQICKMYDRIRDKFEDIFEPEQKKS